MAMLTRYDPFRETVPLVQAMNKLFEDSFVRPMGWWGAGPMGRWSGEAGLPVDVEETEDAYVVTASLPGWKPEEVSITAQGGTLTISGERKPDEAAEQGKTYHLRERSFASFSRSVTFPQPVDADKAEASYEHGVLTLTVPKAEGARPRRIPIVGNGQKQITPTKAK